MNRGGRRIKLDEYAALISRAETIYIFGVAEDGKPYIIVQSDRKLKVDRETLGEAKIIAKPPLITIQIKIKQGKIKDKHEILILPESGELKNFLNALLEKKTIYLSLMDGEGFKELYRLIADEKEIEGEYEKAVTFEIPVENVDEIDKTLTLIKIIDKEVMDEINRILEKEQRKNLRKMKI